MAFFSSGSSIYDMVPQNAGYGAVVPGAPSFGKIPGLNGTPNASGGVDYTMAMRPNGGAATIAPWMAPPLPGFPGANPVPGGAVGIPGTPGAGMGGNAPASPLTPSPVQFGGGLPGAAPVANPGTPAPAPAPAPQGGGSFLDKILAQISGTPFQPLPTPPNMGLGQGVQNVMAYNTYLQNLANQSNDAAFKQAVSALTGAGTTARTDAQQIAQNTSAQNNQDAISRGLYNSTVPATLQSGVDRNLSRSYQSIDEGIAQQLVNLLQSKQTSGPNTALLAQLMQGATNQPNYGLMGGIFGGGITHSGVIGPQITPSYVPQSFPVNGYGQSLYGNQQQQYPQQQQQQQTQMLPPWVNTNFGNTGSDVPDQYYYGNQYNG